MKLESWKRKIVGDAVCPLTAAEEAQIFAVVRAKEEMYRLEGVGDE